MLNICNLLMIVLYWFMCKFVDTDEKLAATRRERFERG